MKKNIGSRVRFLVVLVTNRLFFMSLKRNRHSKSFIEVCILAQNLRTNSERKKAEEILVYAAVSEMKNIHDLDAFIRIAALHSTKNLAVEIYARMRWIKCLKEFPELAKRINVKRCGGKKAMKALTKIMMPRFKSIENATPFDLSCMANVIHALPERERNEALENISKVMTKKVRNEKEFFCFLEMVTDLLAHNCMIAHFATSGKMKNLDIAEKVLAKIKPGHPSANAAIEAVIMESIQYFKTSKVRELNRFLTVIKTLNVTDKLQAAITKVLAK